MVLDLLENKSYYYNLHSGFSLAFRFIEQCIQQPPAAGKYPIDGDKVFALVQEYTTTPGDQMQWESHRRYIDIQCIICGEETIEWANIGKMPAGTSYDEEKDCFKFTGVNGMILKMVAGDFAVFYPHDLHKPNCILSAPSNVKKIVVKVAL